MQEKKLRLNEIKNLESAAIQDFAFEKKSNNKTNLTWAFYILVDHKSTFSQGNVVFNQQPSSRRTPNQSKTPAISVYSNKRNTPNSDTF